MTPLSKDAGLRTGVNRRSTMSGFITKTAAGIAAAATLIGGLAIGASSAQATTTTSYDRTLGNAQFEAARTQNALAKEMNYGSILHAWMWSFNAHRRATVDSGAQTGVFRQRGHVRCLLFSEGIFGCAPHGAALRCCPLDAGNAPSDQAHSSGQSDGASVRNHCATVCGNALCSDLESYVKCSRKRFCELG